MVSENAKFVHAAREAEADIEAAISVMRQADRDVFLERHAVPRLNYAIGRYKQILRGADAEIDRLKEELRRVREFQSRVEDVGDGREFGGRIADRDVAAAGLAVG